MNDLWRYNIATNTWTWMKGSQLQSQPSVYGVKGVEDSLNTPGAREAHCRWKDNNGNLWLFGGCADISSNKVLNDLWRYNPVTNNWAWINGDTVYAANGSYGIKGVASPTNKPGARLETRAAWRDQTGNLWMFGGGIDFLEDKVMNDIWMYSIASDEWTWIAGDSLWNPSANYGTINVAAPTNTPNGRGGSLGWADKNCNLYMFGGTFYVTSSIVPYNDLWKYTIDSSLSACLQGLPSAHFTSSDTVFCDEAGKCISFTDHSTGNPTSWQWFFTGAIPDTSTLQNPDSICYYTPGTYPVRLIVSNSNGTDTLLVSPLIVLATPPALPTITQSGDTLYSSHSFYYQWYFNGSPIAGATDSFYLCNQQGLYAVQITDSNGCSKLSNGFTGCITGISDLHSASDGIGIYPNPARNQFIIYGLPLNERATIDLYNVLGEKVYSQQSEIRNPKSEIQIDVSHFSSGVYFLRIQNELINCTRKLIKQ
jgi:PKD repeat protein